MAVGRVARWSAARAFACSRASRNSARAGASAKADTLSQRGRVCAELHTARVQRAARRGAARLPLECLCEGRSAVRLAGGAREGAAAAQRPTSPLSVARVDKRLKTGRGACVVGRCRYERGRHRATHVLRAAGGGVQRTRVSPPLLRCSQAQVKASTAVFVSPTLGAAHTCSCGHCGTSAGPNTRSQPLSRSVVVGIDVSRTATHSSRCCRHPPSARARRCSMSLGNHIKVDEA